MSVLEISRVDRLERTYDLAALFPELDLTGATASLTLLPKGSGGPTAATVWTAETLTAGSITVTHAGPDADSTSAFPVPATGDLWVKVTTTDGQVDAAKLGRINVLGGSALLSVPANAVVYGTGAGGFLSGEYPSPGVNTVALDNAVEGLVNDSGSDASAALRAALVPFWKPGETVTAGTVRMTALGMTIIRQADGTTRPSYDATEQAAWAVAGVRLIAPSGDTTGVADTAAIQAAIDAGGVVQLGIGVFYAKNLLIKTGSILHGSGIGSTTIKLPNGANVDLVTTPNFASLTGGNTSGGETKFSIEHLVLDGNGANQTATSWPFRVYAYNYRLDDFEFINGYSGNLYSEWGNNAGGDMEAIITRFKLLSPISDAAVNMDWRGPHDSIVDAGEVVAKSNANTLHQTGVWSRGNAGGDQFTNVHVWGYHQFGWIAEHSINAVGCDAEGAWEANVVLLAGRCNFRGRVFGTNGFNATEVGVRIGDATHTNVKNCHVDVDIFGFAAGAFPFHYASSGGKNRITGTGLLGTATAPFTGTQNAADYIDVTFQDGTEDQSKFQLPHPLFIRSTSTSAFAVGRLNYDAQNNNWDFNGATLLRGYKDAHVTQTWLLDTSNGAIAPGTAAGVGARIFSGSGAPTLSALSGDFYLRKDTAGVAGQRIYQCNGGTSWSAVDTAAGAGADVQVFTASGTWTKPAGAAAVSVLCIGPGGGGGSGGRFASGQVPTGGGGGGGGGLSTMEFPGSTLPATVTVTVGTAGIGGAAQTVDSTAGNSPTAGTATTFGAFLQAGRGGGGVAGGNGVAASGAGGGAGTMIGGSGAGSLATGLAPSAALASQGIPGGGGGGGITAAGAAANGSAGAASSTSVLTAGAGGTVGAGQNGANGTSSTVDSGGSGGGGGAANATAAAGAGGNGGSYGAGGGGGGASLNGFASGKGGDGGPGIVVVITKF